MQLQGKDAGAEDLDRLMASSEGKLRGSLPKVNRTTLSRTMPPATVAISQAFEPRWRTGAPACAPPAGRSTRTATSAVASASGKGQPSVTAKV